MSAYFVCGAKDKNKTESGIRVSLYDGQRHVATSTISPWNVLALKQDLQVGKCDGRIATLQPARSKATNKANTKPRHKSRKIILNQN